ncbi:glycosyltransferase [Roseinatronobacter sp.]
MASFQHILIMRFSYPALGGFKLSKAGPDEVRATLYDPARLERRFALFEKLALPSLLNQRPNDCEIAIIIGEDFPQPFRARLERLTAPLPRTRLFPLPPMDRAVANVVNMIRDPACEYIATTRLDDDDAMALDCLGRIGRICRQVLRTKLIAPPLGIAFNKGLFLEKSTRGVRLYGAPQKTPLGIGLTLLAHRDMRQTVYTRNHRAVGAYWNCITDGMRHSFIRTVHVDNDSGAVSDGRTVEYDDSKLREILTQRFGLDLDDLRAI